MSSRNSLSLGVVAALAALAGVLVAALLFAPAGDVKTGTMLQAPRPLPEFSLQGLDGQPFTKSSLAGRWSLVFVGFTQCPDICPSTLQMLKMATRDLQTPPQVLLLSVDPERDSPERLAQYVRSFDPRFTAATGPNTELDKLARAMGFIYAKVPQTGGAGESYTMDHTAALILVNPRAEVAGYFTPPFVAQTLGADLAIVTGAGA